MIVSILSKKQNYIHFFSLMVLLHFSSCQKKVDESATTQQLSLENSSTSTPAHIQAMKSAKIQTPSGATIYTILAITPSEHEKGLSTVKPEQWPDDYAMLFASLEDNYRTFWMPDTYFDLDIFFLDKDFKVLAVERSLAHHPGRENEGSIPRTRSYVCRHVLEFKSTSPLSASLNVGDKLSWMDPISLEQTISNTLQAQ